LDQQIGVRITEQQRKELLAIAAFYSKRDGDPVGISGAVRRLLKLGIETLRKQTETENQPQLF